MVTYLVKGIAPLRLSVFGVVTYLVKHLVPRTAAQLTDLLRKTVSDGALEIDVDTTFNQGSITVELDSLSVDEPLAFADVIYKADNFGIYPLTNGKIRLDVTFQSVLKTIR